MRRDGDGELTPLEVEGICWYVSMVWRYADKERWCVEEGRFRQVHLGNFMMGFEGKGVGYGGGGDVFGGEGCGCLDHKGTN